MAIRHASVGHYISYTPYPKMGWSVDFINNQSLDDTYITIFGPTQDAFLSKFEQLAAQDDVKILFKSEKAYNYNYDDYPRNTLVIFELGKLLQI